MFVRRYYIENKSGIKYRFNIYIKKIKKSEIKTDPVLCYNSCKSYILPISKKEKSCPCWGKNYSCNGKVIDFNKLTKNVKGSPVLVCVKLSINKKYDNDFSAQFFGEKEWKYKSKAGGARYIYGKLDIINNALWKLIRKLKEEKTFAFASCKLCGKRCNILDGKPCRMKTIYSMERTGVLVGDLIKKSFNFELQWIHHDKNNEPIRPKYLCSAFMTFSKKKDIINRMFVYLEYTFLKSKSIKEFRRF